MKKARDFCKAFMWASIGTFSGKAIATYTFYKRYPKMLELISAPWYAELRIPFIAMVATVLILIIIRVVLKKRDKEQ